MVRGERLGGSRRARGVTRWTCWPACSCLASLLLAGAPAAAQDSWRLSVDAPLECVDAEQLRFAVEARAQAEVFSERASRSVEVTIDAGVPRAEVVTRTAEGEIVGRRGIAAPGESCHALDEGLVLVVASFVRPLAPPSPIQEVEPELAPPVSAEVVVEAPAPSVPPPLEVRREGRVERELENPEESCLRDCDDVDRSDSPIPSEPPLIPPSAGDESWVVGVGVSAEAQSGLLPDFSPGMGARGWFRYGSFGLITEAVWLPEAAQTIPKFGKGAYALVLFGTQLCAQPLEHAWLDLAVCGGGRVGPIWSETVGPDQQHRATKALVTLGAMLWMRVSPDQLITIDLGAGLDVPLAVYDYAYRDSEGRERVFHTVQAGASLRIGLSIRIDS